MPASFEDIQSKTLDALIDADLSTEEASVMIKNLKILADTQATLTPDPEPEPEPKGTRAWLKKNSTELIKAGTTLTVVGVICFVEGKDLILRSKATKFI